MLRTLQYISLLLIFLSMLSCAETSSDAPTDTSAHQSTWLNPQANDFHGAEALQKGTAACVPCHGPELTGSDTSASCFECHFDENGSKFPVGSAWTHGVPLHADQVDSVGTCNNCHESLRAIGLQPDDCHDCHAHSHGQVWMDKKSPSFHGLDATQDLSECAPCHGSDYQGGLTGVSCYLCHFDEYGSRDPSESSWGHGQSHSIDVLTANESTCNQCHNTNRAYGNEPSATGCHDCHTHPLGQDWLDKGNPTFHGVAASQDLVGCAWCHGSDYLGGSTSVSCYQCHFDEAGGKEPSGSTWVHGQPHSIDALTADETTCNQCHNTNRAYGSEPSATGCHDCHTHPLGQDWLDKGSPTFHGIEASQDLMVCASCHGSDYLGGLAGVGCYQCHFDELGAREPFSDWLHGQVHFDENLIAYETTCNQCHNTNRAYGNDPSSQGCHDCHTHPRGQEWLDKGSSTFHGIAATQDMTVCADCHGEDFLGGTTAGSCYQCHFDELGAREPLDSGWLHGPVHDDVSLTVDESTCNLCHNTNRTYGNGPPSQGCHDCHIHPLGQEWLDKGSSTFHGIAATQDMTVCAACHGEDFQGGSTTVNCYQCHFDETGAREPLDSGWLHGPDHTGALRDYETTCNQCHNTNSVYGNPPTACHDCHKHELGTGDHGADYLSDPEFCNVCHSSGEVCIYCHGL